ncbi:hypothetical protein [Robbsia andropogonis]|uniref:hypothetical protein n=1 Tax=Robbsia andropogonis TaxID=28092 RepID=UPI000AC3C8A6|nr:hypothetical protein [Robbsia andropogonis]
MPRRSPLTPYVNHDAAATQQYRLHDGAIAYFTQRCSYLLEQLALQCADALIFWRLRAARFGWGARDVGALFLLMAQGFDYRMPDAR